MVELVLAICWILTILAFLATAVKWDRALMEVIQLRRTVKMQEYEIKRLRAESDYAETVDCIQAAGEWATLLTTNADDGR